MSRGVMQGSHSGWSLMLPLVEKDEDGCAHLHRLQPKLIGLPHFFVPEQPNLTIATLDCY